jgi:hypothetical protein
MRPKITTCHHISRSIAYNEHKVELGAAERLTANQLLRPLSGLTTGDILHRFERRMELNDRVRTSLHITLNFDPQDTLYDLQMEFIAHRYMKEIGFSGQPWIAWRHDDAGHPHCHIVTTHVQWNGDPIDLYYIGQNQSEQARLAIEQDFHLVTSESKQRQRQLQQKLNDANGPTRLKYGEKPLARAISEIVDYVTETYRYANLQELNAVLRLYNVEAYTGRPDTKLFNDRGLLYRALDEHGHYIGRPLKASFFDSRPTLDRLQQRFDRNQEIKQYLRNDIEGDILVALYYGSTVETLTKNLQQKGKELLLTRNKDGDCTDMTIVDLTRKVVFTSADLTARCNHESIQQVITAERLRESQSNDLRLTQRHTPRQRLSL